MSRRAIPSSWAPCIAAAISFPSPENHVLQPTETSPFPPPVSSLINACLCSSTPHSTLVSGETVNYQSRVTAPMMESQNTKSSSTDFRAASVSKKKGSYCPEPNVLTCAAMAKQNFKALSILYAISVICYLYSYCPFEIVENLRVYQIEIAICIIESKLNWGLRSYGDSLKHNKRNTGLESANFCSCLHD
ncbi:hypothetical protein Ancab_005102 [Ancistrocladus abbreviatus]